MGFYYGNTKNRFWLVLEEVFKERVPPDIQGRRTYLLNHHIALWDVLASCVIAGSSDASIRNPIPNNLDEIFSTAAIRCVLANGQLASRVIMKFYPLLALGKLCTLPSTSPANASWSLERLVETWSSVFL